MFLSPILTFRVSQIYCPIGGSHKLIWKVFFGHPGLVVRADSAKEKILRGRERENSKREFNSIEKRFLFLRKDHTKR